MGAPRSALRAAVPWTLAALVIAICVGAFLVLRDSTPLLDREELTRRREAWLADPILDYELTVRVEKDRLPPERYEISVRGGRVVSETLNGLPTRRGEEGSPFSIDGLFDTIEETADGDLEKGTVLLARFDERRSFPEAFKLLATNSQRRSFAIEVELLRSGDVIFHQAR